MASTDLIPIIPTIILAIVAFYGAILSTINFFKDRKRERPQIDVVWYYDVDKETEKLIRCIAARNVGMKPITLDFAFIEEFIEPQKPWFKWFVQNDEKRNPRRTDNHKIKTNNELSSGKCYEIEIYWEELDIAFGESPYLKLIAVFVDQLGKRYQSKPFLLREFL